MTDFAAEPAEAVMFFEQFGVVVQRRIASTQLDRESSRVLGRVVR